MVIIPKMATQWKVIHEFKPTDYSPRPHFDATTSLQLITSSGNFFLQVKFPLPKIALHLLGSDASWWWFESDQLPKLGEWNKIEISLEKEEGKHFISLSVGDKQVLREEVDDIEDLQSESDGFAVCIGHDFNPQPGFIRGLVVLEKQ